ncbi:hypothetical protein IC614_03040 [Allosphingosinicella flava]|uniref:Uncharacterized protein n=1 Tax=Allosphingosinicella flava TaxID=2771430 RepID=A0A7T2GKR6_9SPHN|nr:hypothetical protein [Sphingosinicella flava]QPQ55592.1 hypothetical protein IC614_03040 [Sphingosinicella flava]
MTAKKSETGVNLKDNAPEGYDLSEAEKAKARTEGAKDAEKEAAKDTYRYLTDGQLPGDPPKHQYFGADDIMQFEPLLGLGVEAFEDAVDAKADNPIPEEKAAGLLRLERNGQNRTAYVKALMKRLGLKTKEELYAVSPGGPDYTNDVTPITKL